MNPSIESYRLFCFGHWTRYIQSKVHLSWMAPNVSMILVKTVILSSNQTSISIERSFLKHCKPQEHWLWSNSAFARLRKTSYFRHQASLLKYVINFMIKNFKNSRDEKNAQLKTEGSWKGETILMKPWQTLTHRCRRPNDRRELITRYYLERVFSTCSDARNLSSKRKRQQKHTNFSTNIY